MRSLKYTAAVITVITLFAACGKPDKKTELANLIKQRDELNIQISKLEKELKPSDTAKSKYTTVSITEMTPVEFNHYLEVQGKVDGEDNVGAFSSNNAIITAVYVKQGDIVKKGQVLAQLDNSILLKSIEATKVNVDLAVTLFEKTKSLWDQKIGTEVQYLQAKSTRESAEKQLAALKEQLDLYLVKSPITGSVEEVTAKVGMFASPSNPQPLFRVVNFNSIKILADIAESYAPKVKSGNPVKVYFPDFDTELNSTVRTTSKYINPTNRTFTTEIRLGPSKVEYRANMMAVVKINDYHNPKAFTVPITVIRDSQQGKYIYIAKEEGGKTTAHRVQISVGNTYNGLAEITGISEGDKVITTGYNNLIEGEKLVIK
jgi:RND family efflux transporter MFP subunit